MYRNLEIRINVVKKIFGVKEAINWFFLVFLNSLNVSAVCQLPCYLWFLFLPPPLFNCKVLLILLLTTQTISSFLHFWPSHFSTNELESSLLFPTPILKSHVLKYFSVYKYEFSGTYQRYLKYLNNDSSVLTNSVKQVSKNISILLWGNSETKYLRIGDALSYSSFRMKTR